MLESSITSSGSLKGQQFFSSSDLTVCQTILRISFRLNSRCHYSTNTVDGKSQDLKFHLQDVHCVDLRRGCKRSSPDFDADPRTLKTRISGEAWRRDSDPLPSIGIKQEYKFVDEAAKISAKEVSRSLSAPTTSTRARIPSLDFSTESAKSGSKTPFSSTYSFKIEKIDLRLLADAVSPFIKPSIYNTVECVDLTRVDKEVTSSQDRKVFLEDETIAHSICS